MSANVWVSRPFGAAYGFAAALGLLLWVGGPPAAAQEMGPAPVEIVWDEEDADAEHLLSGPMHEAFASPVNFDPQPGLIVPVAPPEAIDEMPPDVRPEEGAIWIEGYWAWDDERENFIWVSGVYRVPPVGRRWLSGYWEEADDGFQWVPGIWVPIDDDDEGEVNYLPEPPETLEAGPTSLAPSENHFWVNGHWNYIGGSYVWRPGFWSPGYEQWVWVPAHYVWTPRGYVFVRGYWDYRLVDRGIAFAPVYWHRPVYRRAGFYYRPIRVIDLVGLHLHLFVRPSYYHYYYGDWYGPSRWGIHASFVFHGRYGYDPLWTYHNWYFGRRGIDYHARVRGWHVYFGRHVDRRPPRTWRAQRDFTERRRDYEHLNRVVLGRDLDEYAAAHPRRVARVGEQERQRMRDTGRAMRELRDVRREAERVRRPETDVARRPGADRERLRLPETADVREMRERMARVGPERRPPTTRSETRPTVRREVRPTVERETRPTVRREARPTPRPEVRPTRRPETRPTPRPEARPTPPSAETRPTPRPEARPTPRPEARPTPRPEVRPTRRPEVRPTPRPEARPTPRPEVRPTPRPEARPTPRPEARPTQRPEVRPTGRPEARPTPRPEARPTPRPEARPTQRPEARPTGRPEDRPSRRPAVGSGESRGGDMEAGRGSRGRRER